MASRPTSWTSARCFAEGLHIFSADGTDQRGFKPMNHEKLSGDIIGAVMNVLNELGHAIEF